MTSKVHGEFTLLTVYVFIGKLVQHDMEPAM